MCSHRLVVSVLLVGMAFVLGSFGALSVYAAERSEIQMYVDQMHPGWNLGNTFDATGSETSWGNPRTTKELIEAIAEAGFRSIRIPVTWGHRMGDAPDYEIDPAFMARIGEVVQWALDAGLYVMLNVHHDTGWIMQMDENYDEVLARFNAAWVQIADYFKNWPTTVMFEALNEPRFSDDWNEDKPRYFELVDDLYTSFHQIVRNSGGDNDVRPVVLSPLTGSSTQIRFDRLAETIEKLDDENIIATFHYYGYWPFSVNIAGSTIYDNTVKYDLMAAFDRAYQTFVAKGIPVIVGEYGLLGFDKELGTIQHGEILKYFEMITYYAQERDIPLMLWDNGQHFNRRRLEWYDETLYNTIMVGAGQRSSTTNTDSIFLKKGAPVKNRSFLLNLNGNDLVDIRYGDRVLQRGVDYAVSGFLTFSADFLRTVIVDAGPSAIGEVAALTCEFSAGTPWNIYIIAYDTPVLESVEERVSRFRIPTEFNGDRLATMEATYASGGNAGPQDWTSYKEFNYSFRPLYDNGSIELTSAFFREVRDGEVVNLKLHFWSGEVVEYTVQKNGLMAVGNPK